MFEGISVGANVCICCKMGSPTFLCLGLLIFGAQGGLKNVAALSKFDLINASLFVQVADLTIPIACTAPHVGQGDLAHSSCSPCSPHSLGLISLHFS